MSGFNTHEGRMARRVVDCFTTDALRQIQSAVNGDEYVNEYRGGMGSDIRYLSDFAVEQIKNAVSVNGGGGTDVIEIKSIYKYDRGGLTPIPITDRIAYVSLPLNATYYSINFSDKEVQTSFSDAVLSVHWDGNELSSNVIPFNDPRLGWILSQPQREFLHTYFYKTLEDAQSNNPYLTVDFQYPLI